MELSTHSENRKQIGSIFARAWWNYCNGNVTPQAVVDPKGTPTRLPDLLGVQRPELKCCNSFAKRHLILCARDHALKLLDKQSTAADLFLIEVVRHILTNVLNITSAFLAADAPSVAERAGMVYWHH